MYKIILKKGREKSVLRFHPWLFSGAIEKIEGNPTNGSVVLVYNSENVFLGSGYYGMGSIAVRFLTFSTKEDIESQAFWDVLLGKAFDKRVKLGLLNPQNNCFRLVHGEGDDIPGLILDYYNGVVVFQAHNSGIYVFTNQIIQAVKNCLSEKLKAIFHKPKEHSIDDSIPPVGFLFGSAEPGWVKENGFEFFIDWMEGQKTGFFLDQRESRALVSRYAKGRTVLNTFSYTGGFSVYAGAAGAQKVVSVDISAPAIAFCKKNLIQNGMDSLAKDCLVADSFNALKETKGEFDLIILDPPSFAKSIKSKNQAVKGYRRLNQLALKCIGANGVLFTFSCTQVVDRELFEDAVYSAALEAGRNVKILHRLGQPPDHPINFFHPESDYLKGLVLWVE
jgi:23S rRNA (cytosine1962-C5)-methyltransferase